MTLSLVLTFQWYDLTASDVKNVEYRRICEQWTQQIWAKRETIKHVKFFRGMTKTSLIRRVTLIDIGPCPIAGWEGDYYRIHFER